MLKLEAFGKILEFEGEVLEVFEVDGAKGYVMDTYCKDRTPEEIQRIINNCSQIAIDVREKKSLELLEKRKATKKILGD